MGVRGNADQHLLVWLKVRSINSFSGISNTELMNRLYFTAKVINDYCHAKSS